jgi:hypothetical protein
MMKEQEVKDAARMKAWSESGARVVNLDQASPHRSWIEGFNTAWQSAMHYQAAENQRYREALEQVSYLAESGAVISRESLEKSRTLMVIHKIAKSALGGE